MESSDIAGCTWVTAPHPQPLLLISNLPCRSAARPLAWLSRAKAAHTAGKQPYRAHDQPLIFLAHLPEQRLVVAVVRLVDRRNPLASRRRERETHRPPVGGIHGALDQPGLDHCLDGAAERAGVQLEGGGKAGEREFRRGQLEKCVTLGQGDAAADRFSFELADDFALGTAQPYSMTCCNLRRARCSRILTAPTSTPRRSAIPAAVSAWTSCSRSTAR
ncbi:MAG: hypothetical protein ABSH05_07645 [Bryobacteraceae bacterium]